MFYFTYKCRMCGKMFRATATDTKEEAVDALECSMRDSGRIISDQELHWCDTNIHGAVTEIGIADLIGAKFTPDS